MKITSATYRGIETPFTVVEMTIEHKGHTYNGRAYYENDGRDVDLEGGLLELRNLNPSEFWNEMHSDENLSVIEPILAQGYKAWEVGV